MDDLVVKKASIQRGGVDAGSHRRVRFTIVAGVARIIEQGGSVSHEGAVASYAQDGRVTVVTLESGDTWTVTRMGCNCGGG